MSWGTVQVGRLTLRETFTADVAVNATTGSLRLALSGQESVPPLTAAQLRQRQEDILALRDHFLPIVFTNKSDLDGFYLITDANTKLTHHGGAGALRAVDWSLAAERIGPANAVDIESRITGVVRANDHALTGERWHAPAGGHVGYLTGTTQPSGSVTRAADDGAIVVYRGVPAGVNPRWACSTANYLRGRAQIAVDGLERSAVGITLGSTWTLSNGLVKVAPGSTSTLTVSTYDGGTWEAKDWNVTVGGVALTSFDAVSIVRNDFEACTIRMLKSTSPGRYLLDLTVRRGSRVVECHLQSDTAVTAGVRLATGEAATAGTGYVVATGRDSAGNRATCGCPRSFTADTTNCGLSKASVTALSFYVGSVVSNPDINVADGTFESGVTGWSATGGTFAQSSTQAKFGTYSGKLTVTGSPAQAYARPWSLPAPVTAGSSYTASFWGFSPTGWNGVQCVIDWLDAGQSYLDTSAGTVVDAATGAWEHYEVTATAPVGAAYAVCGPTISNNPTAGEELYVDAVRIALATGTGDAATVLRDQYLVALAETTMGVTR